MEVLINFAIIVSVILFLYAIYRLAIFLDEKESKQKELQSNNSSSPCEYDNKTKPVNNKKELYIKKEYITALLISLAISFISMLIVEHFGEIRANERYPRKREYSKYEDKWSVDIYNDKLEKPGYYSYNVSFTSPFGSKKEFTTRVYGESLYDKNLSRYYYTGVSGYSHRLNVYFKAIFTDFKYFLLIWVTMSILIVFFTKFKIRIKA